MVTTSKPRAYRFIADQMLGRLAKWLRLVGYDTIYFHQIEDSRLLRLAREEERILLTRDTSLMERREIKQGLIQAVFVESDQFKLQLHQLKKLFKLKLSYPRFCPQCNVPFQAIEKTSVKGHVPSYVYQTQNHFFNCPQCKRYFWAGTHWQNINEKMRELKITSKQ